LREEVRTYSKYIFALLVSVYMLTVVGMPVYLHYCGGEVEDVSYLIETNGCCEDEEPNDDCCRNEGLVLQNAVDFTVKTFSADMHQPEMVVSFLSKKFVATETKPFDDHSGTETPVPWQHSLLAEITVLRI
jgi:hypothetical protein